MNQIGQRIKQFRKQNGLTQEKLADYLGVTDKAVSKWECGLTAPDLALIMPLARVLGVSADELLGGKKEEIKVIGIRHGEKMYETLLTNEECAKAEDMGDFYRVPADNRTLNYDKYFSEGDTKRCELTEFNSDNTTRLTVEETKAKIASLEYIQNELNGIANVAK